MREGFTKGRGIIAQAKGKVTIKGMKSREEKNLLFLEKGVNSDEPQGIFSLIFHRTQPEKEQNLQSASKTDLLNSRPGVRITRTLLSDFEDGAA